MIHLNKLEQKPLIMFSPALTYASQTQFQTY